MAILALLMASWWALAIAGVSKELPGWLGDPEAALCAAGGLLLGGPMTSPAAAGLAAPLSWCASLVGGVVIS